MSTFAARRAQFQASQGNQNSSEAATGPNSTCVRWSEAEDQIPEEAVIPGRIGLRFVEVRTKETVSFGDDYGNIMYLSRDGTHDEGDDPPPCWPTFFGRRMWPLFFPIEFCFTIHPHAGRIRMYV